MRRLWLLVGMLVVSCSLFGCGDGSGESTATPDNLGAAADAAKKMQLREAAYAEKKKLETPQPGAKAVAEAPKSDK